MLRKIIEKSVVVRVIALALAIGAFGLQSASAEGTRGGGGGGSGGGSGGGIDDDILFDILGVADDSRTRSGIGGGSAPDFVIVNGVSFGYGLIIGISDAPGDYEVVVDFGDSYVVGVLREESKGRASLNIGLQICF